MGLGLGLGLGLDSVGGAYDPSHRMQASGSASVSFAASYIHEFDWTSAGVATPVFVSLVNITDVMTSTGVATVSFQTETDTTAPVLSSVLDADNDEIDVTLTELNYPVTIRWQIRAIETSAPDQAAMLAGTGGVLNGSAAVASTPDSIAINIGTLIDATEYTLYVMASDPSGNHSSIDDIDWTYEAPSSVTLTSAGVATVSFAAERIVERTFAPTGTATVTFIGSTTAGWMTGAFVIDGGTSSTTTNDAVDGGTASLTYNDLIGGELAA